MAYPVILGKGKLVLKVFGHPICNMVAKLSYAAYMTHWLWIEVWTFSKQKPFFVRNYHIIVLALGFCFLTFLSSLFVSLFYEAPFGNLEKTFLFGQKKGRTPQPKIEPKEIGMTERVVTKEEIEESQKLISSEPDQAHKKI